MTADPKPAPRVVVLQRAVRFYPDNYWAPLIGMRMPAVLEAGRVMVGVLVAVEETSETVRLEFSDLQAED